MTVRRPGFVRAAAFASVVLLASACTPPWAREASREPSDNRHLSRAPEPLAGADETPPTTTSVPSGGEAVSTTAPPAGDGAAPSTTRATGPGQQAEAFGLIFEADDAAGDAGVEAQGYGDLRRLRLASDGRRVRVTVDMAADIRQQLASGEVMGLGVDLYRSAGSESDYQLFADGGSDGWRAYLQTPDGFVQYPGSFRMGGTTIEFEVPWSAIGGPPPLEVSVFLDWSKERVALNASSSDRLPDRGRLAIAG